MDKPAVKQSRQHGKRRHVSKNTLTKSRVNRGNPSAIKEVVGVSKTALKPDGSRLFWDSSKLGTYRRDKASADQ